MIGEPVKIKRYTRINAAIPAEWFDLLKEKAEAHDISLSQILRHALLAYFPELDNG